jgi:hypothetical protein
MNINFCFILFILLYLGCYSIHSQTSGRDLAVIRYAKKIPVNRIEPGMVKLGFERWLKKTLGQNFSPKWEVNDCGEQSGTQVDRGRDFPMCVEAMSESIDVYFVVSLMVGTFGRGTSSTRPQLRGMAIHIEGEGEFEVKKLSGLKSKLRELGIDTN